MNTAGLMFGSCIFLGFNLMAETFSPPNTYMICEPGKLCTADIDCHIGGSCLIGPSDRKNGFYGQKYPFIYRCTCSSRCFSYMKSLTDIPFSERVDDWLNCMKQNVWLEEYGTLKCKEQIVKTGPKCGKPLSDGDTAFINYLLNLMINVMN